MLNNNIKILYIVNNLAFFVSHRLPIAIAARDKGYSVNLISGLAGSSTMEKFAKRKLQDINLSYKICSFSNSSINAINELIGLIQLMMHINKIQPTIVHCISPKGIIYGGLVSRITKTKNLILAISGMGFAFTTGNSLNGYRWLIYKIQCSILSVIMSHPNIRIIVQNENDRERFLKLNILGSAKIHLISGSGIDLKKFIYKKINEKEKIVLFPARMLWDKGVREFVEAARQIKKVMPDWRFIMAGAADYQHPTSVPIEFFYELNSEQIVEWIGYVDDLTSYYLDASIVCLPSYREGFPKCLLEAAAAGCAIVTTNTVGCRDSIEPNVTGLLVPIRSSEELKKALLLLMQNRFLRENFGKSGRELAIKKFGIDIVVKETLAIYKDILGYESSDAI